MHDLYKGATRPAMLGGVPTSALIWAFLGVAMLATMISIFVWIIFPFVFLIMRLISKKDDRAFRLWGMWFDTKKRCNPEVKKFWGGTSYTPMKIKHQYQAWRKKDIKK